MVLFGLLFLSARALKGTKAFETKKRENSEIFYSRNLMAYICHESFQFDWFLLSGTVKSAQQVSHISAFEQ